MQSMVRKISENGFCGKQFKINYVFCRTNRLLQPFPLHRCGVLQLNHTYFVADVEFDKSSGGLCDQLLLKSNHFPWPDED